MSRVRSARASSIAALLATALAIITLSLASHPTSPDLALAQPGTVERLGIEILAEHPHDPEAHTQGLLFHQGHLYESEGKDYAPFGSGSSDLRSSLRRVDPETGEVLQRADRSDLWAEGLARVEDRLVQISYLARRATYYDLDSFEELAAVDYEIEEGWGLCHDAPRDRLLMSDGSARLYLRQPETFAPMGSLTVTLEGQPLTKLNELECVGDHVYANLFPDINRPELEDQIARIDIASGQVTGLIDAGGLLTLEEQVEFEVSELNGIAHDAARDVFYLTGKHWPKLFEVRLRPEDEATPATAPPTDPPSPPPPTPTLAPPIEPEELRVRVLEHLPHDDTIYTQGLLLHQGILYESAGNPSLPGGVERPSSLRAVEPETGRQLRMTELDEEYYGEGLARVDDRLFWITWQNGLAFEFDLESFDNLGVYGYSGQGWGLCYDGQDLYMSDGSNQLTLRDPEDFSERSRISVRDAGLPANRLNELECVDDSVYANVWKTDTILRIDKHSGQVTARIDASGLRPPTATHGEAVLNGIAHDPADGSFLITGKWWDVMYRVRFLPADLDPLYLPLLRANQ